MYSLDAEEVSLGSIDELGYFISEDKYIPQKDNELKDIKAKGDQDLNALRNENKGIR